MDVRRDGISSKLILIRYFARKYKDFIRTHKNVNKKGRFSTCTLCVVENELMFCEKKTKIEKKNWFTYNLS